MIEVLAILLIVFFAVPFISYQMCKWGSFGYYKGKRMCKYNHEDNDKEERNQEL